jgi:stringent starvation protein B
MRERDEEKKSRLIVALEKGMVMLHIDARRQGVSVPVNLKNEPHVRLNVSYRFDPPDLAVNDWGIRATLTFPDGRFQVAIPWSALFAMTSHVTKDFWFYPEDMPPELFEQTSDKAPAQVTPVQSGRPALRVAELPKDAPEASAAAAAVEDMPAARQVTRGHLRLVK